MSAPIGVIPSERSESRDLYPRAVTNETFTRDLLAWLNARFCPAGPRIEADTPLFAGGIINSLGILELIAWTERATGRRIADSQIRTDYFGTAARIASLFAGEHHVGR